jgi:HEPN domain-containing protein
MSLHDEQSRELLSAAARDELTCRILRRDAESPVEATLFHAQQTLEKGLKAVLVSRGIVFRRTHDLLELLELAKANGLVVPADYALLARLAPYAVEFRYIGVTSPTVSLEEAQVAVDAIMTWARAQIGVDEGNRS